MKSTKINKKRLASAQFYKKYPRDTLCVYLRVSTISIPTQNVPTKSYVPTRSL